MADVTSDFFLMQARIYELGSKRVTSQPLRRRNRGKPKVLKRPVSQTARSVKRRTERLQEGKRGQAGASSSWKVFFSRKRRGHAGMVTKEEMDEIRQSYSELSAAEMSSLKNEACKRTLVSNSRWIMRKRCRTQEPLAGSAADAVAKLQDAVSEMHALEQKQRCLSIAVDSLVSSSDRSEPIAEVVSALVRAGRKDSKMARLRDEIADSVLEHEAQAVRDSVNVSPLCGGDVADGLFRGLAGPQGLKTLGFKVPVKELVSHSIPRLPTADLLYLRKKWHESSSFLSHASQPKVDLPKSSLKRCHFAGRCVCSSESGKHLGKFVSEFEAAVRRVFPQPRKTDPDRKQMRLLLKRGDVVVHMSGKRSDGGVAHDWWFHIAYVNMNSWEMSLLRLETSQCQEHCARVAPLQALEVPAAPTWACSYRTFSEADLQLSWHMGVHTLIGNSMMRLPKLDVRHQQVLIMTDQELFWSGVPAVPRRLPAERQAVVEALADGAEAAPSERCPPDRGRAIGAEGVAAAVAAQADEDEEAPMAEDDLIAVLEGVLEEMDAEVLADDLEDDLPIVSVAALMGGASGASSSSTAPVAREMISGHDVQADSSAASTAPEPPPQGSAPADASAEVDGEGCRGYSGKQGPKYPRSKVPDARPGVDDWVGEILVNKSAFSLDAHCRLCKCRINRVYKTKSGTGYKGRPLGTQIAWLQVCPKRTNPDATESDHRALLTEEVLPHATRLHYRLWGETQPSLDHLFEKERDPHPHEASSEPLQGCFKFYMFIHL
jgi:hypothetical protein